MEGKKDWNRQAFLLMKNVNSRILEGESLKTLDFYNNKKLSPKVQ